jgi:UDP-3-O-acyl N-acetylglucosamine deacetylase
MCGPSGEVEATAEHVVSTLRGTTLGRGEARVGSVEHLMAALYGMGVDNVRVEVNGSELPACDGSARDWVEALMSAGRSQLGVARQVKRLREAVWVEDGASWAMAAPASGGPSLAVEVDFAGTVVGKQRLWMRLTRGRFMRELASARTFVDMKDLEGLRARGLARGGGQENAFGFGSEGYSGPLRFPDEVVRHKALDMVGDLALCGARLEGLVVAVRPSHKLNVALALALRRVFLRGTAAV